MDDACATIQRDGWAPARPVDAVRTAAPRAADASLVRLGVTSGETRPLSLNEAIRRALENNNEIEMARNDVRLAENFLRSLEGVYDPFFQVTPQLSNAVSPQESSLGGSDQSGSVTQTDLQLNPSINKRIEVGGGQYNTFFNNNRRTTSSTFNRLNPVYSANLGISFTSAAAGSCDRSNPPAIPSAQRLDIRRRFSTPDDRGDPQVQRAYWDLVFALRDEQNRIANLNLARENFRRTEAGVAAGASAPLERAEVQTELSNRESDLLIASQNVSVAENNLKLLILRDPLSPDWSAALVPTDQPSFDSNPVNLQDALTEARANRPELSRLRIQQEISDIDLKFFKTRRGRGLISSRRFDDRPGRRSCRGKWH